MVVTRPPPSRSGPSWLPLSPLGSIREELRLHARYIRDTLAPMLAHHPILAAPELRLLATVMRKVEVMHMRIEYLRYSRMEKALMLITDGTLAWPTDIVDQARELLESWESALGPLRDRRADLYVPGGRMEGLREMTQNQDGIAYQDDARPIARTEFLA